MKSAIVLFSLFTTILANPDGYFHQQYQYKSSSSSYKNNELAHKDEDEGFYSSHGDLEGRTKPKVNSYSQHNEYTNPKFKNYGHSQALRNDDSYTQWLSGGQSNNFGASDFSSGASVYGQGSGAYGTGTQGLSSYKTGGYSGSISFGSADHSGSLYPTGQLQILTQQLQDDLSRQLQNAIHDQRQRHHSSSYSYGSTSDEANIQLLTQELQNNLTRQLQEALDRQYGQQTQSGSHYYSITSSGKHNSQPNYSTAELNRLQKQLEDNLKRQLQHDLETQSVQTLKTSSSSGTSFSKGQTSDYGNGYQKLGSADSQTIYLTPGSHHSNSFSSPIIDNSKQTYGNTYSSSHGMYNAAERLPVHPVTDVDRKLGRNLINQPNQASDIEAQKYSHGYKTLSSSYGNQNSETYPNYQSKIETPTDGLQHNITRKQKSSYHYTIKSGSAHSRPNYQVDKLINLRQPLQVENHHQDVTEQVEQIGGFGQKQVELIHHDNSDFGQTQISNLNHHSQGQFHVRHHLPEQLDVSFGNHNQGNSGYTIIHSPHQNGYKIQHGEHDNGFTGQIHYGQPPVIKDAFELTDLNHYSGKRQNAQLIENLNKQLPSQKQSGYNHHSSYSSYSSSSSHTSYGGNTNDANPNSQVASDFWKVEK